MADSTWDAIRAWDYLVNQVFQAEDTLPFFAYAVGCKDVDDFLYLSHNDFGIEFNVTSSNEIGESITTRHSFSRVLIGKLVRAQQWYGAQSVRDYSTWRNLNLRVLNEFHVGTVNVFSTGTSPTPSTPTPYTPIPVTFPTDIPKVDSTVAMFMKSIK
jgi:hypothetical protein